VKDKILVPSVIITLSLMVIFMLICVKEQSFFAKHAIAIISDTSQELKDTQKKVELLKKENYSIREHMAKIEERLNK